MRSVLIVSKDVAFSEMLFCELQKEYNVSVSETLPAEADCDLLIFDADSGGQPADAGVPTVYYGIKTKEYYKLSADCVFFHRPFDTEVFAEACRKAVSGQIAKNDAEDILFSGTSVIYKSGRISLTPAEYAVLYELYSNKGKPVSRKRLAAIISGDEKNAAASNCADVYIRFLRKKLEEPYKCRLIRTVRGYGYTID
ncbi:MAG: winged-helix domain-containing protein [Clostridia bacterium]|nr:winged-helix domain-containing protein [Clostridia bacterium]